MDHRDKAFSDEEVVLDGNTFTRCTFNNCRIVFRGTTSVTLIENKFLGKSRFALEGPANQTLRFLAEIYKGGGERVIEEFFEAIRQDKVPPA